MAEEEQKRDIDELLAGVTDDPEAVKAISKHLVAYPPTENDPVLIIQFRPNIFVGQNVPQNPIQAVQAALVASGGVDLGGYGIAFSFSSADRLFRARTQLKGFGFGGINWAFYRSAAAQRGGPPSPQTIDSFLITGVTGSRHAQTAAFQFFEF